MKYIIFFVVIMTTLLNSTVARTIKTSIEVLAEINTSVRVYVNGEEKTNKGIQISLTNQQGYMAGTTPEFRFVGNASSVTLKLEEPVEKGLVSENGDTMLLGIYWVSPDGYKTLGNYPLYEQKVFPTLEDISDAERGIKVYFKSTQRSESYPLGSYSGTYKLIVTPAV